MIDKFITVLSSMGYAFLVVTIIALIAERLGLTHWLDD
jgi:hypothetical protein